MADLIIYNAPKLVWVLAINEVLISILCIYKSKKLLNALCFLLSLCLAIDAFIIVSGYMIGEGTITKSISQIRYILHGILVPLLIPIAFYMYGIEKRKTKTII